jgi:D-beta-D-heptose 7-phosphate kinase/D-beta-D-heptose 1-phosphate adenosyltransferase
MHDLFGPGSNVKGRIFKNYEELAKVIANCRGLGLKIVLTSGTFDFRHTGHERYLEKAKENGDILIVGVDSDEKVKARKGPHRPVVPEDERMEGLCHCRHVDLVFLKQQGDEKWQLTKTIKPDILIATAETYDQSQIEELKKICGEVVVLEPQATTSTTARIRRVLIGPVSEIKERLKNAIGEVFSFLDEVADGQKPGGKKNDE